MEISPSKTVTAGPDNCTCAPIHATLSAPPRIRTVTGESARPRRMAITAAAHAPEPHASVSPAPRSWTRNLSSEREMICIKPALTRLAKRGCASSAAPSALTGAQSTSSTVCTACGFPIETMETHTFLPFSCNGQSVSAPAGRLWSPAILNGARRFKHRLAHIHCNLTVAPHLKQNESCLHLNGNLAFPSQSQRIRELCNTSRAVAALFNFNAIGIKNAVSEICIRSVRALDDQHLVRANSKAPIRQPAPLRNA